MVNDTPLVIAGRSFTSRLIVGSGKYPSHAIMAQSIEASGADMVTVAVRRVNISDRSRESLLDYIDTDRRLPAAQHGRLLFRRRGHSHGSARPRGGVVELGQARGDRR
jgi:hypothetical protein